MTKVSDEHCAMEDVLGNLRTVAIFKDFLRTINSSEYISAWAAVNRLLQVSRIDRPVFFSVFKRTYIKEDASKQIFIDYTIRVQLEQTKLPDDPLLERVVESLTVDLQDGFIKMMSDPEWKKRIINGTPPKWVKRRFSFQKLNRRDSDEAIIQYFQQIDSEVVC